MSSRDRCEGSVRNGRDYDLIHGRNHKVEVEEGGSDEIVRPNLDTTTRRGSDLTLEEESPAGSDGVEMEGTWVGSGHLLSIPASVTTDSLTYLFVTLGFRRGNEKRRVEKEVLTRRPSFSQFRNSTRLYNRRTPGPPLLTNGPTVRCRRTEDE